MDLRWLECRLTLKCVSGKNQFLMAIKVEEHVMGAHPVDMFATVFLRRDDFALDIEHQLVAQGLTAMAMHVPAKVEEF